MKHFDLLNTSAPREATKDPLHQLRVFLLIHNLISYCDNKSINQFRYYAKAQLPDYCDQDSDTKADADMDDINDDSVRPIWLLDPNQATVASANQARLHGVQFNSAEDLSAVLRDILRKLNNIDVTTLEAESVTASVSSSTGGSSTPNNATPIFIGNNNYHGTFLSPANSTNNSDIQQSASENEPLIKKTNFEEKLSCCLIL